MPKINPDSPRLAAFLQARGIDRREAVRNGSFKTLVGEWVAERRVAVRMKYISGVAARVQASKPKTMSADEIKATFANMRPGSPEASAFYKLHRNTLLK